MRLTRYTDYALRTLMYLGLRPDDISTIEDIAGHYGISRNHLMKIVHRLGRAGLVETVRGRGGGLRLGRAPDKIGIGDVVRLTEDDLALVECFDADTNRCVIAGGCVLQGVLHEALDAFLSALDGYTLADLLRPRTRLSALLGLPKTSA